MIPKEAIEAAISAYMKETGTEPHQLDGWFEQAMSAALTAAFSAMSEPVCHLVWLQSRRTPDDVEDYYEVSRPGDKSVDGSDPFPVYAAPQPAAVTAHTFQIGDFVRKRSGSWWEGRVVGFYSTDQTPDGVCVQLDKPMGPVQIYPVSALEGGGE